MDIVEWDEDPAVYIANALNPAEVSDVIFDLENPKSCTVVVPDNQLSLAIGKRGQNARLAAKLTNHKIDIKPESQMQEFYAQLEAQEAQEDYEEELVEEAFDEVAQDVNDDVVADEVTQEDVEEVLESEDETLTEE